MKWQRQEHTSHELMDTCCMLAVVEGRCAGAVQGRQTRSREPMAEGMQAAVWWPPAKRGRIRAPASLGPA